MTVEEQIAFGYAMLGEKGMDEMARQAISLWKKCRDDPEYLVRIRRPYEEPRGD